VRSVLQRLDQAVGVVCKWGVIGGLLGLFFLLLLAVIVRLVPFINVSGYDEIVELLFAWLTFLGALALWREGALYRVVVIQSAAGPVVQRLLAVMIHTLMLVFALVMSIKGYEFLRDAGETTPFLGIDKSYWYLSVPATGAIMAIYSAAGLWRALRGEQALGEGGTILG